MKAIKTFIMGYLMGLFQPASVQDIFKDFQKKAEALDKLAQRKLIEADDRVEEAQRLQDESTSAYREADKARESADLIRSLFPVS